ncbi:molybdate ABC transporter substrate-binding protein [Desulfosoma caldarium]|uniref:Molybdate transport system substrate-binding protein n=1 Tax=Desulfosoma caldarium TaxID=610254 RepID=A0A3N1UEN7_9BACT|nr:molybdate ABC transporter substrate-binding protein [Desulfosoma caldarium]ROQ89835.1 molybdate transport system substrate-binding protein [Desulfosoma caldarium]
MAFNLDGVDSWMKSGWHVSVTGLVLCFLLFFSGAAEAQQRLLVYAGAASQPPTEKAAALYEKKTGVKVDIVFGGSGYVLSQMKLAKQGDIYFPGSSDYMELAKRNGDVFPETERNVVYLVPAINVPKGNPLDIRTLADLTRPGIKVAIANPEGVCVGAYAVEIIEKNFTPKQKAAFKRNLTNYTGSCEKTATAISLKQVDAVIGWRVFQHWDPERIETVPLHPDQIPRIGYIPIAIAKYTQNRQAAQKFIDFILSSEGQAIFAKYKYFATPDEAFAYVGAEKPVGGEYVIPTEWLKK